MCFQRGASINISRWNRIVNASTLRRTYSHINPTFVQCFTCKIFEKSAPVFHNNYCLVNVYIGALFVREVRSFVPMDSYWSCTGIRRDHIVRKMLVRYCCGINQYGKCSQVCTLCLCDFGVLSMDVSNVHITICLCTCDKAILNMDASNCDDRSINQYVTIT